MHAQMATKTISLDLEAYECLRRARLDERESFSRVIKRALWPAPAGTAGAMLAWRGEAGELEEEVLERLDAAQDADAPAESKWS